MDDDDDGSTDSATVDRSSSSSSASFIPLLANSDFFLRSEMGVRFSGIGLDSGIVDDDDDEDSDDERALLDVDDGAVLAPAPAVPPSSRWKKRGDTDASTPRPPPSSPLPSPFPPSSSSR